MRAALFVTVLLVALAGPAFAMAAEISVRAPWSRPAIGTGVVYLTITNRSDAPDRLIDAASTVAGAAEIHESTDVMPPGSMSHMAGRAVSSMNRVSGVFVRSHATAVLRPGGYHIMLIGLHRDLRAGEIVPLRLRFARTGWIEVRVPVRPI